MKSQLYNKISQPGKKFALLIDPDNYTVNSMLATLFAAEESGIDLILVGGSLVRDRIDSAIELIKKNTGIPLILFPGSLLQLSNKADGLFLLSLISGRNPDYLIGNHVLAAPYLKDSGLEIIPTGYILVGEGNSSVEYISNTKPIPEDKTDIITATAIAGELTGNKTIYLESGSGASRPVDGNVIKEVKRNISIPLIVGGGIRTPSQVHDVLQAGADVVVVGNAVEKNIQVLDSLVKAAR
ncbi:MAG: geranylgeranylglyceryl/heptaprenylglyceryl phosphate synthase [Bacteroidales bacterium]|jgi:putative glycerol-1-phosphate prenyltransferase